MELYKKIESEMEFNERLMHAIKNAMPEIDAMQRKPSERTNNVAAMGLMSVSSGVCSVALTLILSWQRQEVDTMDTWDDMQTNYFPAEIGSSPVHAMPRMGREGGKMMHESLRAGSSLPHLRGGGNVLALAEEKPYTSQERKLNRRLCKVCVVLTVHG